MVRKIILLNSANYDKAILTLDTKSIQIVGKNNIGKTTLISVLNFLYIRNHHDWNFIQSPKETLHYYFPKLDKTYIIFEIHKTYSFCILIRREDDHLVYYKINRPFNEAEQCIFEYKDGQEYLLDFDSIKTNLLDDIHKLDLKDFSSLVYGNSKRDKSVLWLAKDIKHSTFSKIYRNLLNPQLITNDSFKESLLVADSREKKEVKFNVVNNQNIQKMQKLLQQINNLNDVEDEFVSFKTIVNEYTARTDNLQSLLGKFKQVYQYELAKYAAKKDENQKHIDKYTNDIIPPVEEKSKELNVQKGILITDQKHLSEEVNKLKAQIAQIDTLDPIKLQTTALSNKNQDLIQITYSLHHLKVQQYTLEGISSLISKKEKEIHDLRSKIKNYENFLIHHISSNPEIKARINSVLSDDVLNLDHSNIKQKAEHVDKNVLELYDAKIDISSIHDKPMTSIEDLQDQLNTKEKEYKDLSNIKTNLENKEKLQKEKDELEQEIKRIERNIELLQNRPLLTEDLKTKEDELSSFVTKLKNLNKLQEETQTALNTLNNARGNFEQENNQIDKKISELNHNNSKLEELYNSYGIKNFDLNVEKSIHELLEDISNENVKVKELSLTKHDMFNKLKHKLYKEHANEEEFIKEVDEELDTIKDKQESVNTLVESITNETSKPTQTLLTDFEHFDQYIISLNSKLKKYQISDLKTIEIRLKANNDLISELNKIANINKQDLFSSDSYNEQVNVLTKYINQSKKVHISEMFEIAFIVNGKERDLKKQIESNGTDIMLKTSLLMLIIGNLIIQDEHNKLVLYLDELSAVDDENVLGFVERSVEQGFLPVFASPDKKAHIEKYYDLIKSKNSRITVDEKRAIYAKHRI